jgi:hypothetical protein
VVVSRGPGVRSSDAPGARETRIQLPAGSMRLKPLSPPLLARARGRVIRGTPVIGSRPNSSRSPALNASCTGCVSETATTQVEWLSSGSQSGMP